jgi:hypothetical protein
VRHLGISVLYKFRNKNPKKKRNSKEFPEVESCLSGTPEHYTCVDGYKEMVRNKENLS